METNKNEVSLKEIYEAAKLYQVPGVVVDCGSGRIVVSIDQGSRYAPREDLASNLVARTSLAIGHGLVALFPSRKFSREKFSGKNVGRSGHWNMGVFHTSGLHSIVKIGLLETEQNQLIWGNAI